MDKVVTTYGIIGYPVAHSLSPLMHNTAFRALNVEAVYELFPLQTDELESFFNQLKESHSPIFGLNVTVPYKEVVMAYLDSISPFAQQARAVNTITVSEDRKLVGYNTDGPGFLAHLAELRFDPQGKRIAILGSGGTTRSIIASLSIIPEKPESIRLYNRTEAKAQQLIKDLSAHMDVSHIQVVQSVDDLNIELADLLVNTTSVGLQDADESFVDKDLLHQGLLVYDVIYQPVETQLLKLAKHVGARTANGLGMLYYQGMLSLQHWAGQEIPQEVKNIVREALEKKAVK